MSATSTRWEYVVIVGPDQAWLTELGDEGWELAGVAAGEDGPTCYFKRPALDFRERVTLDQKRRYYAALGTPLPAPEAAER